MNYSFYKQAASIIRNKMEKRGEVPETDDSTDSAILATIANNLQRRDAINNALGTSFNTGMSALPYAFIDVHPPVEHGLKMVEDVNIANKELLDSAKKHFPKLFADESSAPMKVIGKDALRGSGKVLFNNLMPGLGLYFGAGAAKHHWNNMMEDPSVVAKAVAGAQTAADAGLLGTDTAWILSQLGTLLAKRSPWIAKSLPWLNRTAAYGFKWAGPAIGYSALWDLGNEYRKGMQEHLESAVDRQGQRDADSNDMAALGNRMNEEARSAREKLPGLMEYAELDPDDPVVRSNIAKAQKIIATSIAIPQSQTVSNKTNPLVFGSTNNVVPTGELLSIDMSQEKPKATNKSYRVEESTPPMNAGGRVPKPEADHKGIYSDNIARYENGLNAHPTQWVDEKGNTSTFSPEYYTQLIRQINKSSPYDNIPWWMRPFMPTFQKNEPVKPGVVK